MDQILCVHFDAMLEQTFYINYPSHVFSGLLIGYERKARINKTGVKTHVIVCFNFRP